MRAGAVRVAWQLGTLVEGEGQGEIPGDLQEAAICASAHGIDRPAFSGLPDAAKYAWAWRVFNETALEGLESLPNVKSVIHEELCAQPEAMVRDLFSFAGLAWNAQTARFLAASTSYQGPTDYFSVFRNSAATVDRWRSVMALDAQEAVRSVVRGSRLVRFWPDLAESERRLSRYSLRGKPLPEVGSGLQP
jgi:hypothetical protein